MAVYRKRQGIMLAYPFDEKLFYTNFPDTVMVQPKLDGLRCRAIRTEHDVMLISSEGNKIESLPLLNSQLNSIPKELWQPYSCELDGEIYTHGMSFEQIVSYAKRKKPKAGHIDIGLHLFDIKIPDRTNYSRNNLLSRLLSASKESSLCYLTSIHQVETTLVEATLPAVYSLLSLYVERGYEGIIIRKPGGLYEEKRSKNMLKIKPRKEDTYTIVGCTEEVSLEGKGKDSLGSLICEKDGERFHVGSGFTREQRELYWKSRDSLLGRRVLIKYQELTKERKVPRFPIISRVL